jgi:hypothetical protein
VNDHHPRYVLRESVGGEIKCPIAPGNPTIREWLIMDSWYCYRVVWQWRGWASPSYIGTRTGVGGSIAKRRRHAEVMLGRFNAEHDAWLAAG